MAVMIPEKPRKFAPASLEGIMFEALEKLPEEYYVFHSFRITTTSNSAVHESETDFIIYNRSRGVICLEAKAGQVHYENGEWLYGNGISMHNDGPFNQASSNKHKLRKYIDNSKMSGVLGRCKFLHAVWFPSISDTQLNGMALPSEADRRLILTKEALKNPERFLNKIYDIDVYVRGKTIKTDISDYESKKLIKEIFCPEVQVFPTASFESDLKKMVFHRLLKEQSAILNFLDEQRTAAINGAAGTGKTMIACEKARRHAAEGERVLFLCFNVQLRDYLEENYANELISYYTIAGFACKLCNTSVPDYEKTKEKLMDMYIAGSFPYKHVIIDEGQDFGNEVIEEADIIEIIHEIIADNESVKGSFYIFYDRLQLVQAKKMPKLIENLDCRLTLYRNCRNTENIATTSLKPITERKPKLFEDAVKGEPAVMHYCVNKSDEAERINVVIQDLENKGYKDIVLLTCKTENTSAFANEIENGKYHNKYLFTTCRKFKGLEADAVILTDVDKDSFEGNNVLLYYVGTSRARLRLDVMLIMSDEDCKEVLTEVLHYEGKIKKVKKDFSAALNATGKLTD